MHQTKDDLLPAIRAAFAEVLGSARISDRDSFFDAGGDSIAAEVLILRLAELTGQDVPGWMLLDHPSVAELADALTRR